jgi:CheY-like chemotaxis protein
MGNVVCRANDGLEAVATAESFRPDIVLMDLGMPRLDGYEAAKRIRQAPWGRALTLVATSGWGQEEHRRRSREAGFDHHLVKPVDVASLRSILHAPRPVDDAAGILAAVE